MGVFIHPNKNACVIPPYYSFLVLWEFVLNIALGNDLGDVEQKRPRWLTAGIRKMEIHMLDSIPGRTT